MDLATVENLEKLAKESTEEFISVKREELKYTIKVLVNSLLTLGRQSESGMKLIQENMELKYNLRTLQAEYDELKFRMDGLEK